MAASFIPKSNTKTQKLSLGEITLQVVLFHSGGGARTTPSGAQCLLLALVSEITSDCVRGTFMMLRIEPGSAAYKANALIFCTIAQFPPKWFLCHLRWVYSVFFVFLINQVLCFLSPEKKKLFSFMCNSSMRNEKLKWTVKNHLSEAIGPLGWPLSPLRSPHTRVFFRATLG